ncbi:hypothetical protein J6590_093396 [Homalodisca vitripennis]|nr:hypothetical protein J6590_093396 [Homalodisca vitripennis]
MFSCCSAVSPSDNLSLLLQDKVFDKPSKAGLGASQHSGFPGQHGVKDQISRLSEYSEYPRLRANHRTRRTPIKTENFPRQLVVVPYTVCLSREFEEITTY